jgi:7-keto-8-aminopelargonate synthetase and related enzymes
MSGAAPLRIEGRSGGCAIVNGRDTIMLGLNDYLGLATDPEVIAATKDALSVHGAGAGIYPVFASTPLHEALCGELAAFLGTEAVLLYSSGGAANSGVLTTLAGEGDVILSDRLNHASIIDGCRLSRAETVTFANRDAAALAEALGRTTGRRRLIVTDGIFSMEGAAAPLKELHALAMVHDALLVLDEAHATGVVGPEGRGTATLAGIGNDAPNLVLTGSLSKALGGASGGFVAGARATIEALRASSRGYIFTQGMTTANAATALAAVRAASMRPELRARLVENVVRLRARLTENGVPLYESDSAIIAVKVGDEDKARALSRALLGEGVQAPAVAYPIVARDAARLRLQPGAAHEAADLDFAAARIAALLQA